MSFKDLREFIEQLEAAGELKRIDAPVNAELEITEITDRMVKSGGPALLFTNVRGHTTPLLINIFGTHRRTAMALGVEHIDQLVDRVRSLTSMAQAPPTGIGGKLRALGDMVGLARSQPRSVHRAPCQEIVLIGDDVDLYQMPIIKCWPDDAGPFITLPLVISQDPDSGRRNVGTYRMQVYDRNTTGMHWQTHKVGARHDRRAQEQGVERLEVAVALGGDPATIWTGSMPLPPDMDEFAISGVIREEAVEVVQCKTVDLQVPAHAEYILEGYVIPGEVRDEGPFGDHTGYYSPPEPYPVFHVTAMTRRRDPIYPTTMVGRPPSEDFFMGKASERIMLPVMQMALPEVIDVNMPAEGVFKNLIIVSIRKEYPGHAQKVMHALWGLGLMMLVKSIVVVDHTVDVQDLSEVAWRVTNNINPATDFTFADGPLDDLDHATPTPKFGSKVGIDATAKISGEGGRGAWPQDIVMSDEISRLVDSRWQEYGF